VHPDHGLQLSEEVDKQTFRSPTEVSRFQSHSTKFKIATSATNSVNSGRAKLGVGWGSSSFILSLLLEIGLSPTSCTALVSAIT
jgi:hypothetical protein